jgi:isopenicillin N synthase-like dioxygenase
MVCPAPALPLPSAAHWQVVLDLNFMTIHGKSRFPGLYVWTREGVKMPVKMPEGCLLIQAGKQFEWLTGGHVLAGFHEVVVSPATLEAVAKAK